MRLDEYNGVRLAKYSLVSINDPFDQDDWEAYSSFSKEVGGDVQVVDEDLLATNPKRIQKPFDAGAYNAPWCKMNQSRKCYKVRLAKYSLVSIEDPLPQDDWDEDPSFTKETGNEVRIAEDYVLETNPTRIQKSFDVGTSSTPLYRFIPQVVSSPFWETFFQNGKKGGRLTQNQNKIQKHETKAALQPYEDTEENCITEAADQYIEAADQFIEILFKSKTDENSAIEPVDQYKETVIVFVLERMQIDAATTQSTTKRTDPATTRASTQADQKEKMRHN